MSCLLPPDPDAVLLCQLPGMDRAVLARLIERWETATGILRAPSAHLRAIGVSPALVARIVGAPRQRAATEAGLKSLLRMGIYPVPFFAPDYPARLRAVPDPPLLLHIQGAWPLVPASSIAIAPGLPDQHLHQAAHLSAELQQAGVRTMTTSDQLDILPAIGSVGVLDYGLLLARSRVPEALRAAVTEGSATLLSVAPVNAPTTPGIEAAATQTLVALVDGLVTAGTADSRVLRPDLHHWRLAAEGIITGRQGKVLRMESAAATIARTLGVQPVGEHVAQQERLW